MIHVIEQYTDADVIERIKNGEASLYEILIRRYNPFLYKIGRSYRYNHQDTEDLMQETYINAYCNLSKFENRSSFKTWLTKIMLHQCYHKKHKLSFQKEVAVESSTTEKITPMFQEDANTERTVANKELGHALEVALSHIPEMYRIVFTLRELNGLSVAESAEVLEVSENNIKVRMNRAKAMLRTELEKMYSPHDIFEFNLVYCDALVDRVMKKIDLLNKKAKECNP